jgi:hypothetical protein
VTPGGVRRYNAGMIPELSREAMAWTAGVLLAAYALGVLYALNAPARQPDPQRGQAVGCLTIVLLGLLGLGAMLAAGLYWDVGLLVRVPFWVAVFPALSLVGSGVYHLVRKRRE